MDRKQWHDACFGPAHVISRPSDPFETLLLLAQSIEPEISHELVRQAAVERQARFDHALMNIEETILQTLQAIRHKDIKIGLISNASSSEVQAWSDSPLAEFFDAVTFSFACGHVKPELPIYKTTLDSLGVAADQCLFVGDGGSDEHYGANSAGMKAVLTSQYIDNDEYLRRLRKYNGALAGEIKCLTELINEDWLG